MGGTEVLMAKGKGQDTALHCGYFWFWPQTPHRYDDTFAFLVNECIKADVGGEFAIGGLFNIATQTVQDRIYERWDDLLPALISAVESLNEE